MRGFSPRFSCIPRPAAALAAALLAAAPWARADPTAADQERPVRMERPNAVRGVAALFWRPEILVSGASDDAVLGVTYSRQVHSRLALELLAGGGGNGHRAGPHVGAGLRLSPIAWSEHAVTLSLGGRAAFLKDYGTVGFGHLEVGYEMRLSGGFNLAAGSGFGMVLNDSRRTHACTGDFFFLCRDHFDAGDIGFSWRIEIGASF